MKNLSLILLIILMSSISIGCSPTKDNSKANPSLEEAILKETKATQSDENRYVYFYEDLDNDKDYETIAYLWGKDFSGNGGATMLVFDEKDDKYEFISKTTLVNMPMMISENSTNGYNDIIVTVSGGGIKEDYNTVLQYGKDGYPLNASIQPQIDINDVKEKSKIDIKITSESGFGLKKVN